MHNGCDFILPRADEALWAKGGACRFYLRFSKGTDRRPPGAERQWKNAIAAHKSFVDGHPNHAKVPEALRNIGNCYRELGDKAGMKTAWDSLLKRFPKSEAAAKVKQQLAAQNG